MGSGKAPFLRNAGRSWRLLCDHNFSGLWHHMKRALGLRGPVPAPLMPEPEERVGSVAVSRDDVSSHGSALKVLFISHDLNWEGASISLFEMLVAFKKRGGIDPEVLAFEEGPLRLKYEAAGIPVSLFPYHPEDLSTVRKLNTAVESLAGVIRQKNPEVVFANTLRSFLAILAAQQAGIPSVWNSRESAPWDTFFSYLPDPVAQRAIAAVRLPYRVIFVSHASRKVWARFDRYGNFDVIHNGLDISRFSGKRDSSAREQARVSLGLKEDAVAVLCVGTMNARKGQRDLVEAASCLPQAVLQRVEVLLVGDDRDPYAKKLKQRCRALSPEIRERVRFIPSTESVQRFYAAADILVLCSKEESFPRVILEAMAFGLPIITTPVHGVTEQVVEGGNAFFYKPENTDELSGKIGSLVQDEALRKQMGRSSLERLSKLTTFEEMTDAYRAVCREAASSTLPQNSSRF